MAAVAPSGKSTLFDLLGVSTTVGLTELRTAFRRCALAAHPDKGGSNEAFQEVFRAFEVLSDVEQRQKYEQSLMRGDAAAASLLAQPGKRRRRGGGDPQSSEAGCGEREAPQTRRRATADAQNLGAGLEEDQVIKEEECNLWHQLFVLLGELSPGNRRRVASECFTQKQRLALAAWADAQKDAKRSDHSQEAPESETTGCSTASSSADRTACRRSSDDAATEPRSDFTGPHSAGTGSACKDGNAACVETVDLLEGSSSSDSDADDPFAICDASACVGDERGGDMHHVGAAERLPARCTVRTGIQKKGCGYTAKICFNSVVMMSRTTRDLAKALDWLAILTAISSRSRQILLQHQELNFTEIVQGVFSEYQEAITTVGFSVHFEIPKIYWLGNVRLITPRTHSLQEADSAIRRLASVQSRSYSRSAPKVGQQTRHWQGWQLFKQAYLDVCEALGKCRQAEAVRLEGLEAARSGEREAETERRIQLLLNNWSRSTAQRIAHEARDAAKSKRDHWKETRAKMRHELTCGMADILGESGGGKSSKRAPS
ncbi:unnamed protein product [Polarella glacialis]|uniref:J domain-containing protein n=1 Tax=Polarella glacialis TaxID=89957 RepID=A0A813ER00_POLGL|nr:unnamed protein product [Polarella glacialis]CAE8725987.1 unnamed protein product [Polarella glacialis]